MDYNELKRFIERFPLRYKRDVLIAFYNMVEKSFELPDLKEKLEEAVKKEDIIMFRLLLHVFYSDKLRRFWTSEMAKFEEFLLKNYNTLVAVRGQLAIDLNLPVRVPVMPEPPTFLPIAYSLYERSERGKVGPVKQVFVRPGLPYEERTLYEKIVRTVHDKLTEIMSEMRLPPGPEKVGVLFFPIKRPEASYYMILADIDNIMNVWKAEIECIPDYKLQDKQRYVGLPQGVIREIADDLLIAGAMSGKIREANKIKELAYKMMVKGDLKSFLEELVKRGIIKPDYHLEQSISPNRFFTLYDWLEQLGAIRVESQVGEGKGKGYFEEKLMHATSFFPIKLRVVSPETFEKEILPLYPEWLKTFFKENFLPAVKDLYELIEKGVISEMKKRKRRPPKDVVIAVVIDYDHELDMSRLLISVMDKLEYLKVRERKVVVKVNETVVDAFDSLSELLRAFKAQPIRNKYRAREPVWLATYGGEATGVERQYNAIKGMVLRSTDPEVKVIRDGIFSLFDSWLSKVAGKKLGRILNLEVIGLEELGDKAYRELTDEEKRKLWEKMLEFIVIPLWKSWPQYERFELAEALEKLGFTVVIEGTIG